ncbi:MAG: riboflavin biosynthesis protein RibF [Bacillota bacterium]|jgi:riboflavin kinase/FMN adenylyltransferase
MIITSDFRDLPDAKRVLVIGNFDGVHIGHQALFRQANQLAAEMGGQTIALTFHPHPLTVLGFSVLSIMDEQSKRRLIAEQGVDAYVAMPFDQQLAAMSPERFVQDILIAGAQARAVVVGFNFSFGRGGAGTPEYLQQALAMKGVPVVIVPPVMLAGEAVSSTRLRQCIRTGDLKQAGMMLGRPYSLFGTVQSGDQRGRQLGFPTANIGQLQELALPPFGVYAAEVPGIGVGMANLGNRPSFPQQCPSLEVHIFDFCGDLYGQRIQVVLRKFVRDERQFSSLEELQQQLNEDQRVIRDMLADG